MVCDGRSGAKSGRPCQVVPMRCVVGDTYKVVGCTGLALWRENECSGVHLGLPRGL